MREGVILPWLVLGLCAVLMAFAEAAEVNPEDLESLFKTLRASTATEAPRILQTDAGFLHYLGAPPGTSYHVAAPTGKSSDPEVVAQTFLEGHGRAFGVLSDYVAFRTERVNTTGPHTYIHLQQTYDGRDVFGAQMIVQMDQHGGISSVLSDIMRDTAALDSGQPATDATVSADDARAAAMAKIATEYTTHDAQDLRVSSGPDLMVYKPSVIGATGPARLVWHITVVCPSDFLLQEVVLVDAHSAEVVLHYSNVQEARYREVYDANNGYDDPGELVREEGDPPCGIEDADLAYDYLGDTYDFYFDHHDRDSIDGQGMTLSATARACSVYMLECPMQNAFWAPDKNRMYFGQGYAAADDVVAHELTHGVTQYSSQLIYMGESGAINEAFSDIWGEFVDLTNGRGTDTEEVRWLMAEDLPTGAMRNMADPPQFGLPDRMGSPYWWPTDWWWYDNGGVHVNMGVGSKLCYLLADGDTFNGYTVEPLAEDFEQSIAHVAGLFYELQENLLGPASDYHDMYMQLAQATINLDYNFVERMNVRDAAHAVEIQPPTVEGLKGFRATPAYDLAGDPVIALTWENPKGSQFLSVCLVRKTDDFPGDPTDGTVLYEGDGERALDTDVVKNTEYYYSLFADFRRDFPHVSFARATAGIDPPDTLTEAFEVDLFSSLGGGLDFSGFIDLQGCQVVFTPVGAPVFPFESGKFYTDYSQYEATVNKGVPKLPVPREDERGGAYRIPLEDCKGVSMLLAAPFPFFGGRYHDLWLASNGYVSFRPVGSASTNNFPSLAAHYAIPRISFLFADLSHATGGEVWARYLDDRLVITFEQVPEWLPEESWIVAFPQGPWPNTVQLEMFYSGQVRITYLEVYATNVVCGLSDGHGVPIMPADLFPNLARAEYVTDLSELPTEAARLSIKPVPVQSVLAGELVDFVVETDSPDGAPSLAAQWDGPGMMAPFADNDDGTGLFYWMTSLDHDGVYTVRITARLGEETAFQDVCINVGDPNPPPVATDVRLRSENPFEDPTQDRPVDVDSQLTAEYTYFHPLYDVDPVRYGQGVPLLYWFKDQGQIPAFTNQWIVPPSVTRAGETWCFTIIPRTVMGVWGEGVMSPIVTIVAVPRVSSVTPPTGPALGGTTVTLTGDRLGRPTDVTFGSIRVQSTRSVSDTRIEVMTPAHAPGAVDVVVVTPEGTAFLGGGFTYLETSGETTKADVNHDGVVDALDVQLVINAVLERTKAVIDADANRDGAVNSLDIQAVVNEALRK